MLRIQRMAEPDDQRPPTATLVMPFEARTKSRQLTRTAEGEEVGLFLNRGTWLRGGDRLLADDGRLVCVAAAPEVLLEARFDDPLALARAAYHLGNRHVAVELLPGALRILADHVLCRMLEGLGAHVAELRAPFEPESGAYSHGHHHAERGATEARIHRMDHAHA